MRALSGLVILVATSTAAAGDRREVRFTDEASARAAGVILDGKGWSFDRAGLHLETGATFHIALERWLPDAGNPEGWAVELRMQVTAGNSCDPGSTAIYASIGDGLHFVNLMVAPDSAAFLLPPAKPVSTQIVRASAHTLRVELDGGHLRLAVDGERKLDTPAPPVEGATPMLTFGGVSCGGVASTWELIAWETTHRAPIAGTDPKAFHPGVEAPRVIDALAGGLPAPQAARLRKLALSPEVAACAAAAAVDDAVRFGARRAFDAIVHPPPPKHPVLRGRGPVRPPPPHTDGLLGTRSDCANDPPMDPDEVRDRARRAVTAIAALKPLGSTVGWRAGELALSAPPRPDASAQQPPFGPSNGDRMPICDRAGPCDCRPTPAPAFPYPAPVVAAQRAIRLASAWGEHPQRVYDAMSAAAAALSDPADARRLVDEIAKMKAGSCTR